MPSPAASPASRVASLLVAVVVCVSGPAWADAGDELLQRERLGTLGIGVAAPEVVAALGQPTAKGARARSEVDALDHETWRYPERGVTLDMVFDDPARPAAIALVRLGRSSTLRTRRGIGVGSTWAEVEKAYGAEKDAESSEKPKVFVAGSLYGGLVFSFDDGRVTGILLGAAAE